jgi:hypothetical protein
MKVTSVNIDPAGRCGREKCLVTVCVHLAGLRETMTINVLVPAERDDRDVQECGIARAKDFARQFVNLPDKRHLRVADASHTPPDRPRLPGSTRTK